jgi:hypothetical protein
MSTPCTRCEGTGFINLHQIPEDFYGEEIDGDLDETLRWIEEHDDHDVSICDCCGDTSGWYGEPGEHYNIDDPPGNNGPYAYNGGLCACH